MDGMSKSSLPFVVTEPVVQQTVRQKELTQAEIRSHAARVSHRRRKYKRNKTVEVPLQARNVHDFSEDEDEHTAPRTGPSTSSQREPVQYLLADSSDPFHSLGFRITPRMRRIITIARYTFLPSLYIYPYIKRLSTKLPADVKPSSTGEQLAEGNVGLGFWYEECATAWICSHTTSLLRFHDGQERHEMERMALQLKLHSLKVLRDRIAKLSKSDPVDISFIMHIMWLHAIECMARDWDSAKAHARVLSSILDVLEGPQMIEVFIAVMFNDTELAVRKMQRTTLDFKRSFGKKLANFWQEHSSLIPQTPEDYEDLHQCVAPSALRSVCVRLRHFLIMSDSPGPIEAPKDPSGGDIIYAWITSITQYDTGLLLNRFLDLIENRAGKLPVGLRYTQASLTLTALHLLRKYFHESPMKGIDLRDASQPIMSKLRMVLKIAIKYSTPAELHYHREAYLWMLFTGAQHEMRFNRKIVFKDDNDLSNTWFSMMLAEQAKRLGATRWTDARKILTQFLYTDYYEPHAEKWFEATVSTHAKEKS